MSIEDTLQEARDRIKQLETFHSMTTEQFRDDATDISRIDSFDQIEWEFRIAQIAKLEGFVKEPSR